MKGPISYIQNLLVSLKDYSVAGAKRGAQQYHQEKEHSNICCSLLTFQGQAFSVIINIAKSVRKFAQQQWKADGCTRE